MNYLGQEASTPPEISPYVEHPYQTGAGFIFNIIMSLVWVGLVKFGVSYLRKNKNLKKRNSK